jgi:hypothetical protein
LGFSSLGLGYGFLQYLIDGDLTKITTNFFAVLDVSKGTNVTITICNTYSQREGFQVSHYLDSETETVPSNQVITVSFTADQTGSFFIYCTTFSPIHIYLQGGSECDPRWKMLL